MTRNLTNYHSHCSLCDGRAPMEDFVREAVRRGFTSYGISSHAPLPFPAVWTLDRGDVTTYLSEIERLKRSYAGRSSCTPAWRSIIWTSATILPPITSGSFRSIIGSGRST